MGSTKIIDEAIHHPAWIEIDLDQFARNIEAIRNQTSGRLLCVPVKADAYGHGIIPIAKAALQAKVDYLAVSCLQEGIKLRKAGITAKVLVMGAIHEAQIRSLIEYGLEITLSSAFKAALVAAYCQQNHLKCRVHIEIDTGMQRTGMRPETAVALIKDLSQNDALTIVGIYSHLAKSDQPDDPFTMEQIKKFAQVQAQADVLIAHPVIYHLANSGGVVNYPSSHFDMVRPGLLAFGYFSTTEPNNFAEIKPFFSLKAHISYFKVVEKDIGISYGHHFKTKERTRIVTIPLGYGDGFRRSLSQEGSVLIRGRRYPIAGAICMDQFMVDLGSDEAFVGEEVVIIGKQGEQQINVLDIARLCRTIPYEILCNFNHRLPRLYLSSEGINKAT